VYRSTATLKGAFERSAFAHAFPQDATVDWHKAYLSLGLTDQRGIREEAMLTWNGRELPFEPSSAKHVLPGNAIQTGLPASGLALDGEREGANRPSDEAHVLDRHQKQKQQSFQFEIPLVLDGSSGWHTVPVGKQTTVSLAADWADPSFTGAFLPEHDVSDDGFQANWEVFHLNRPFPQLTKTDFGHLRGSSFGVSLLTPVDQYTKTERAVKYGVLVIALTFLALFLVQVMLKRHWHPVRYVLVGLALSLFYVLLLALAEKLGFAAAYALAALATVLLITFYSGGAIRRKAALFGFGSALAAVYGFLFVTLAAEDYALLIGALGLFAVLAAVMALSRRMGVKDAKPEPAQPG
jgi:inner membrane protein